MQDKYLFIDGNSLLNRAYYALPVLNSSEGQNVNAVYGFLNIMLKAIDEQSPTKVVVAFDMRGKNFRKELYPEYKANRKGMPDDLAQQMPVLQGLLSDMQIRYVQKAGVEADDIIGTLCKRFGGKNVVVTGDRDLLQLVSDDTTVLLTQKGVSEVQTVTIDNIDEEIGLTPRQIVEYKAIRGDASDNIPGVVGIGEKGALNLLAQYGDVDGVYAAIDKIKGSLQQKLIAGKDMAYLSRRLATIDTDAAVECDANECGLPVFGDAAHKRMVELEFRSIIKRLDFSAAKEQVLPKLETTVVEITSRDELENFVKQAMTKSQLALYVDEGVYLATDEKTEYKVVFSDNFLSGLRFDSALNTLKPLFESDIPKTVYNGKSLNRYLDDFGLRVNAIKHDVDLLQYLAEHRSYKTLQELKQVHGQTTFAAGLFVMRDFYLDKIKEANVQKLYYDVELPLSEVLFQTEKEGVKTDESVLDALSAEFVAETEKLKAAVYEMAGETFNVLSPKQLSVVLYEKLGLPKGKKTKLGYSTDNDALEKISDRHPIASLILKIRQYSKLNGTYVEGVKPFIKNGIIHTHFNQTQTATGRLSSSDPNMQNIPVRDELGKEIRKAFVPKRDLLISADYSQIELRLLAYFSKDKNLIESFKNHEDIHRTVAAEIFGIPQEMVTASMRRTAKAVNFGIIYGISEYGLSKNVGCSVAKAREYIAKYFQRYPSIGEYLESSKTKVKADGYVTTILGRRRYIAEINSSNAALRAFGERAAMNMPLQGSAADLMKIAMINVFNRLNKEGLKSKIIMQIHDELIVDAFNDEAEEVKKVLKEEMENAIVTEVPFDVNIECGANLYETK